MTATSSARPRVWTWTIVATGEEYDVAVITARADDDREPSMIAIGPEQCDRVRSAIAGSGVRYPHQRTQVTGLNTSVARSGLHDLALAVTILAADGVVPSALLAETVFIGQFDVDGRLHGGDLLEAVWAAKRTGLARVVVPAAYAGVLSAFTDIEVFLASNLAAVVRWLRRSCPDYSPGRGWVQVPADPKVREAAVIAAAGGHVLAVSGGADAPTQAVAGYLHALLEPLRSSEALDAVMWRTQREVTRVAPLPTAAPLVHAHHSISPKALRETMIRAHRGVLVCTELAHFPVKATPVLAHLIDHHSIELSQDYRGQTLRPIYPASLNLVLTDHVCTCSARQRDQIGHRCGSRRWAWPSEIETRVDLRVWIEPAAVWPYQGSQVPGRARVTEAREVARQRWSRLGAASNAEVPVAVLREATGPDSEVLRYLDSLIEHAICTTHQAARLLAVAWTVCDLRGATIPSTGDLDTALGLRHSATS
ncbi:ATP-binding protein [Nocardia sp. NPDC051832]|uniref:ATP-binding protein n=1 Tax=Nocardia sp. NPDC051832 TaxID=3155673 RepID=UPI00343B0FF2